MTTQTTPTKTAAELLANALPCPFCGGTQLRVAWWADGDGEYDAIECEFCNAAAPAVAWNARAQA